MAHYNYSPLSPQDMDFLLWETPALQMHGSLVMIFEIGPLANEHGGVDFEAIKAAFAGVLHRLPRYRQKILWVPGEDRAVWVDDPHFNIDYHVRHTALPRPGSEAQLKRLAGRVMEQPLDRERPLWEQWIVEGLEGDRFALIYKAHHCTVDGTSGMDMLELLLSREPVREIPEAPLFVPRPAPSPAELRRAVQRHKLGLPLRTLDGLRKYLSESEDVVGDLGSRVRALGELAQWKLRPASDTPLNGPVGPHRIFDCLSIPLDDIKAVRKARAVSVNDVVLAVVTGAVREFTIARGERPEKLDFRVSTPVNVRGEADRGRYGNRVSAWVLRLPIDEEDPLVQLDRIHESTQQLKDSHQSAAMEMIVALHEWIPVDIQSMQEGTVNLFVTNLPGPQKALYLLGSEMLELHGQAPLIQNLGLAISVMSYNGKTFWGFNADYDRVPDVGEFAAQIRTGFERLAEATSVPLAARATESASSPWDQTSSRR